MTQCAGNIRGQRCEYEAVSSSEGYCRAHIGLKSAKRTISLVYPYVRCVVKGCLVRTKVPNEYGMCPVELWDFKHDAYFQRMKGAA